jgi:FkbM family methyltransferase
MRLKSIRNAIGGLRYMQWTYLEASTYFLRGIAQKLDIALPFFRTLFENERKKNIKKRWLKKGEKDFFFDFNGAKLPDVSNNSVNMKTLALVFEDVFLIPCFYDHNYQKDLVNILDQYMSEGPYGYVNGIFDVTVKKGDVVIDAGAWIGDFSAYVASLGAKVYAFEPLTEVFELLKETSKLNDNRIYPVQKGLSDSEGDVILSLSENTSAGASFVIENDYAGEKISLTTLDQFVLENKIEKVDFIKADIEGAERNMLKGATYVLKTFAPKLAICTYHFPDDSEVLEKIILGANPAYTVVHLRHKLFATVVK